MVMVYLWSFAFDLYLSFLFLLFLLCFHFLYAWRFGARWLVLRTYCGSQTEKKNSSTISISLQDSGVDKVLDMIVKQFLMKLCASFGFRVMQTNRNNITYERWQYVNVFFYHLLAQYCQVA